MDPKAYEDLIDFTFSRLSTAFADLVKQNKEINEGMRVRLHITPKVTIRIRFHLTIILMIGLP